MRLLLSGVLCVFSLAAQDDGKALVERACTKCHKLTSTMSQRNSRARWSEIVDDMIAKGAEATDTEIDRIIEYLTKNAGSKVSVNLASAEQLAGLLDLPANAAAAIVEYRQKNGTFKNLDDLKKVPGLDAKAIDARKDRLDFSEGK
jgi:competence protein ComEA